MNPYETALRIAKLQSQRDDIEAEIQELKDLFRQGETVALVDESNAGRPALVVKITPNTRLDDKLAQEHLAADVYTLVSKSSLDTAKARAFLAPEALAKITKTYDNKVEVQVQ